MSDNPTYTEADHAAEQALAEQIGDLMVGHPCDMLLMALCRATGAVLRMATDEEPAAMDAGFAGIVVNLHQAAYDQAQLQLDRLTMVGGGAVTAEDAAAATVLCNPLGRLMSGLLGHFEPKNVVNSWFSVLLNVFLEGGVAAAQAILRETADGLPRAAAQIEALRAFDQSAGEQGNTGQVGRA